MPDYIYLLENRLSADQRHALKVLRDVARDVGVILFLTGDAVRDLTSGHAVRDIEVAVQGNALKLKKPLEKAGAKTWGEDDVSKSLYLCFPGTVRVDVVSTHRVEFKKPGQPTYHAASIHDDLRRRDFTVNSMAISLNEGSFGLLMDPLNGVADIETRTLRLVSNYGFLEEPALMIRAVRYRARLGWELDPRTQQRYENAKAEGVMEYLSPHARSQELEQIGHEDDGFKVLQAMESEGWMKVLCAQWTSAKADLDKLKALHDLSVELLMQGVHADISAAQMQLLTAKMSPKDLAALKKSLLRPGFVEEWNGLDSLAAGFAKVLLAKDHQAPSKSYRLFTTYDPEAVLWLGFTSKDKNVQERYHQFLRVWPEMRQHTPHALMQEMRIRPELPNYNEIVHSIFLQLIDGKLQTPEEMRAFLEPYSPPAPPPQVTIKRPRGRRAEPKIKETFEEEEGEEEGEEELETMVVGEDDDEIGLEMPKIELEAEGEELEDGEAEGEGEEEAEEEEEAEPAPTKRGRVAVVAKSGKETPVLKVGKPEKAPVKPAAAPMKAAPVLAKPASVPAKSVPAPARGAAAPTKAAHKPAAPSKAPPKTAKAAHAAPAAKGKPAAKSAHPAPKPKPAAKKPAPKPAVKKAALKPHAKPAHKSIPKVPAKGPKAKTAISKLKAKPAPKAAPKAKPHKTGKPAPKKKAGKKR